ncbi:hypothetical protein L493_3812 [Bordetella bronchiseptica 99-R-0433]|uniref:hypothetical protein n=1 Tax=Bordetella bronchiseptica TaxID=518 RepID=UPI00045A3238|nr:hypothetical protein [Bordetella bronchiseptica]KCV59284.1 hypothetical protein L493_3812 [Bordetella bronchiseptica 99-R-0433]
MKIQKALLAIGLAGVCASSFAGEAPFEVSLVFIQNVPVIQIESVADQVTLTGYSVNRGNCRNAFINQVYNPPAKFAYGEATKIFAHNCNVREVVLETDQGGYTYTFSQR